MMAKDPRRRFQTPGEVAEALRPFCKKTGPRPGADLSQPDLPAAPAPAASRSPIVVEPARKSGLVDRSPELPQAPPTATSAGRSRARSGPLIAMGVVLAGFTLVWFLGTLRVRTPEGDLVFPELPEDAIVTVDGQTCNVSRTSDRKSAQVAVVPGTHQVKVKVGGVEVLGDEVKVDAGDKTWVRVHFEPREPIREVSKPQVEPVSVMAPTIDRGAVSLGGGHWWIDGRELIQDAATKNMPGIFLLFGDDLWKDYDFTLEARVTQGNEGFGVCFRADDALDLFALGVGAYAQSWHEVFNMDQGRWSRKVDPKRSAFEVDHWYKVHISARQDHFTCDLDGTRVFDFHDDRHSRGKVGLRSWTSVTRFRNLKVTGSDGKILWEGLPDLTNVPGSLPTTEVALDGRKASLLAGETNLGDLFADALLWQVNQGAADGLKANVALINGGAIQGNAVIPTGSIRDEVLRQAAPFQDVVCLIPNLPAEALKQVLESSAAMLGKAALAQVAGFRFTYDPSRTAQAWDEKGNITTPGERIREITLDNGTRLVADGKLVPGAPSVEMASIDYMTKVNIGFRNRSWRGVGASYFQTLRSFLNSAAGLGGKVSKADYPERGKGRIAVVKPGPAAVSPSSWVIQGPWQLEGDVLVEPEEKIWPFVAFGDPGWTDYDFSAEIMRDRGIDSISLIVRNAGEHENVAFGISGRGNQLAYIEVFEPGKPSRWLDSTRFVIENGRWYTARVRVRGNHYIATLHDGTKELIHLEGDDATYPRGCAGFRAWLAASRYRNIKVTAPDGKVLWQGPPQVTSPLPDRPAGTEAGSAVPGWISLFNGKDLAGWKTHPDQPGTWRVKDGVLMASGSPPSNLYSERDDFGDFHLRAEARINHGGNSGVYIRTAYPLRTGAGYQAQIDTTGEDPNRNGAIYKGTKLLAQVLETEVADDRWFLLEFIADGNHLITKVNGKLTAEFTDPENSFTRGHIALQQLLPTTAVAFRKIEVKVLHPGAGTGGTASPGPLPAVRGPD